MVSRLVLGLAVALFTVACTTEADTVDGSTTTAVSVPETTTTTDPPDFGSVDAGRLAIIDFRGDIVVVSPDGSDRTAITTNAGEAAYTQPIWSPDSTQIAFGEVTEDGFGVRIEKLDGGDPTTIAMPNQAFYMYWAPDGENMGVLHNGARGLDFEMVDVSEGASRVLDQGSPFYFSWSPDSERVAIHEGADRFETLDTDGEREELGDTAPNYLVPQWLPQGILHVVDDQLVVEDGSGDRTALAEVSDQTMFVANSQGDLVAVQSLGEGGSRSVALDEVGRVELNAVSVVDIGTGDIEVVDSSPAIGFWWSPDGESLLILSPASDGESVTARVWSADGSLTDYSTYRPSPIQLRELFPFFPQYAQSMTFWAPDSSGFALAGELDGEAGIWIQALEATDPRLIAQGLWVAWSG